MVRIDEKFEAAISDTDILIDLFKSETLQILNLLFHKIYIPEFIYEKELKKVAGRQREISLDEFQTKIEATDGIFEIVNESGLDIVTKNVKKALFQERRDLAGR
ncbi:MAG: hypothetical protein SCL54_16160 [Bacillota bacterium]|nr:hypothetical protein [Bacillota bacterium]